MSIKYFLDQRSPCGGQLNVGYPAILWASLAADKLFFDEAGIGPSGAVEEPTGASATSPLSVRPAALGVASAGGPPRLALVVR